MKFLHVLNRLTSYPWFITEEALSRVTGLLGARMSGGMVPIPGLGDDDDDDDDDMDDDGDALPGQVSGVGVVVINGTLGNHLSMLERSCGGVDYGQLVDQIRDRAMDPAVSSVLLHFQICPGGMANGCPESFEAIRQIKADCGKPFISVVTGMACSGGYYLAAAADSVLATKTAMVGNIGVIRMVEDHSEENAKEGVKRFAITSASMKDIGSPDRPMTDQERATIQGMVTMLGGVFVGDMKTARPQIAAEVFETGLPYYAPDAARLGLVDGITEGIEEVLASMASK